MIVFWSSITLANFRTRLLWANPVYNKALHLFFLNRVLGMFVVKCSALKNRKAWTWATSRTSSSMTTASDRCLFKRTIFPSCHMLHSKYILTTATQSIVPLQTCVYFDTVKQITLICVSFISSNDPKKAIILASKAADSLCEGDLVERLIRLMLFAILINIMKLTS